MNRSSELIDSILPLLRFYRFPMNREKIYVAPRDSHALGEGLFLNGEIVILMGCGVLNLSVFRSL